MQRDHSRQYGVRESSRQFRLEAARIQRLLEKKMARLPGGRFEVTLSCLGGSKSVRRLTFSASGGEAAADEAAAAIPDVMTMPGNAEKRAQKLRAMLKVLWQAHVSGTPWAKSRQMYSAVLKGAPPFDWWDRVAQCPFENAAVNDPSVSERVYRHVAPLVLQLQS